MSKPNLLLTLTIPGRPISKKNRQRRTTTYRRNSPSVTHGIRQSKAWEVYEESALLWLLQWGNLRIDEPVWVEAHYFLPNRASWPDLLGLLEGTADLLEKAGILVNDSQIKSWDGSRLHDTPNPQNPRVEIAIRRFVL
jgi:Holliday junction resolvase RusA-like endonuclease